MSFGEGNKRERIAELEERLAKAKLAIDSLQAENNRLKGENATLQDAIDRVKGVNGALCAETNRKDERIRELKALVCAECPYRNDGGDCPAVYTYCWADRKDTIS